MSEMTFECYIHKWSINYFGGDFSADGRNMLGTAKLKVKNNEKERRQVKSTGVYITYVIAGLPSICKNLIRTK